MNKGPREKPSRPLRMTRQRRLILAELQGPGKHLTADEAHSRVRRRLPGISLSTVYRNLDILSRAGLIGKLRLGGRQEQYDGGPGRHYHVRCTGCGLISDVAAEPFGDLEAAAKAASGLEILAHQLTFDGLCRRCGKGKMPGGRSQTIC